MEPYCLLNTMCTVEASGQHMLVRIGVPIALSGLHACLLWCNQVEELVVSSKKDKLGRALHEWDVLFEEGDLVLLLR